MRNIGGFGETECDHLFDLIPSHVSVQDGDLRIIRTNARLRKEFGEHVGEYCYRVYKNRGDVCPDCCVQKTFADGQMHKSEEVIIDPHGRSTEVMVHTSPVRNQQGEIVAVVEMFTDISEMKALQKQLETSRQEYKYLFDTVPCYVSVQDRNFRIIEANALFKQDFGDRLGEYCYSVYKGRKSVCPGCCVKKTFADGLVHSCEEMVETRNNDKSNVIIYTAPIFNDRGEIAAVMEMSTNITQVKKLQKELILMGQSVASMAHGIKNILTGLEGGMYVVGSGLDKKDNELVQTGWDMVRNNVAKVSNLVKDLLYCSREPTTEYQEVEPNKIAREVYDLFLEKAEGEGLEFRLELDESLGQAYLDPAGIHTVLCNLVTNAMDACILDLKVIPHTVGLKTRKVGDASLIFEISDNGRGIPPAQKGKLFETSFSREGSRGTGLGLLVTRKIVMEHNGEITFDSIEGVGTTFKVTLPIKPDDVT